VPTPLAGAWVVELEELGDERGFFARSWCEREFTQHGLNPRLVQCNVSFNRHRGTLRGMHFQVPPHPEAKLVRCTAGAIHDVIIDLRRGSASYCRWYGVDLTARERRALFVPEGFAHGFQTLAEDTEVLYQMSEFHHPELARGVRWNDPRFAIRWPLSEAILSARDRSYADFAD
jgi:dTDP-4-dehydrorhamnose 3,5-epimerase